MFFSFLFFYLSAVSNENLINWLIISIALKLFNFLANLKALLYLSKDHMLVVQPWSVLERNEKLAAISVFACISHRKKSFLGMFDLKVLIWELLSINRLPTSSILLSKVTSLHHEVFYYTVEDAVFKMKWLTRYSASTTLTST